MNNQSFEIFGSMIDNGDEYIDDSFTQYIKPEVNNDDDHYTNYSNPEYDKDTLNTFNFIDDQFNIHVNQNKEYQLIEEIIKFYNDFIHIYNINIYIYQQTANILEKYFNFLYETIGNNFNTNTLLLEKYKCNDLAKHIKRNYSPIVDYVINFYNFLKIFVWVKIDQFENYLQNIELKLIQHHWILLKVRHYLLNNYFILPTRNITDTYNNIKLNNIMKNIKTTIIHRLDWMINYYNSNNIRY